MNHKFVFLVALFVAVVGIAMISADTEAGHRRKCCSSCSDCCSSCSSCSGCSGYSSCSGCSGYASCHGAYYGCSGCHGSVIVEPEAQKKEMAPPAPKVDGPPSARYRGTIQAQPVRHVRSQFGFRTAQFVR